jgi:hypothetical protein
MNLPTGNRARQVSSNGQRWDDLGRSAVDRMPGAAAQPVAVTSQSGLRSVVQYQVARKESKGFPSRMPATVIRCAATVPASNVPAAMRTVRPGGGWLPAGLHQLQGQANGICEQLQRRPETRPKVVGAEVFERRRWASEAHKIEHQFRRIAAGHVGILVNRRL